MIKPAFSLLDQLYSVFLFNVLSNVNLLSYKHRNRTIDIHTYTNSHTHMDTSVKLKQTEQKNQILVSLREWNKYRERITLIILSLAPSDGSERVFSELNILF